MTEIERREVGACIDNLQHLLMVLPMIEAQRNSIIHAIKLLKAITDD